MRSFLLFLLCPVSLLMAQKQTPHVLRQASMSGPKNIVCYSSPANANTYVPPPDIYHQWKANKNARVQTADIQVTYEGFSTEAQQAFQAAVDIWETLITSSVPIRIKAVWQPLGATVLGSASPESYYINFPGAQKYGVWYPVALAEKISGKELNGTSADITASFNSSNTSWYFGTTGTPPAGKYDLVSVVLHEIGHGLGITHAYNVNGSNGEILSLFSGRPVVFESNLVNNTSQNLITNFTSPSPLLGVQLTSENLFFSSPLVLLKNSGQSAKIYAPGTFSPGSSIAHLDENTYPVGNVNSLMTPQIAAVERIHNPGPITMSILKDMGWNDVSIRHTSLANTETTSSDFNVVCQIVNDTTFDASSMKLFYTTDGTNFTSKTMTATGNPKEFQATIPKPANGSIVTSYGYYLSVNDNATRNFVNPGKLYKQGSTSIKQITYNFEAGPDTKAPRITHTPVPFVKNTESQLVVDAVISDNIGIQSAVVEYLINDVAQSSVTFTNLKDSTYKATITLPNTLVQGDKIKYRIKATDNSVAHNIKNSPSPSDYFLVNVVSLAPTQDSYSNNFNTSSSDFFGNGFSIVTLSGFADGAIHSLHPYEEGNGKTGDTIDYVYQLRIPIKVKAQDATVKFDEVVLVEPGEANSTFGNSNFFDYVVVQGSKDGGVTWRNLTDGYDCRDQSVWLTRYNSAISGNNSTATGDPTLYKSRTLDLLKKFSAGDEVTIRFRVFSDAFAAGWGWAIDNLKIQIDETPPTLLHNHLDFISVSSTSFDLGVKATDPNGLKNLSIEVGVNGGAVTSNPFTISTGVSEYVLNLSASGLKAGDEIQYKIIATDNLNNQATLPISGFFKIAVLDFSNKLESYSSNFNTANTDFTGNFFNQGIPDGLVDGCINSAHPYPVGFGYTNTSNLQYMLKKPITVSATNHFILYDEILLAEYSGTGVKDYAILEASKDNGVTWVGLTAQYSSSAFSEWKDYFDINRPINPSIIKKRFVDITSDAKFKAGDNILIRFRLFSDDKKNGAGWYIDNLSIQGPVTGVVEKNVSLEIFPNPAEEVVNLITTNLSDQEVKIQIFDSRGRCLVSRSKSVLTGDLKEEFSVGEWSKGVYILKVQQGGQTFVKKFVKI